jgi:hypothetical protein
VYCSDVAGAFDRVSTTRLLTKLRAKKLRPEILEVLKSWLRQRSAQVVVGGSQSDRFDMSNMVYQGTVLGPILWNVFYEDARKAIGERWFTEVVYADDLNAYREYSGTTENGSIMEVMGHCQEDLHSWGRANQVEFDPAKESMHILSASCPEGPSFKLLGVTFDCGLQMIDTVNLAVTEAGWKLKTLLRTSRFYTDAELVLLYKSHLLASLEYKTSAVYHARREVLVRLDNVQQRFLRDAGVDELTALCQFSLAPLSTRRDIAMLGMIHRTVIGKGPPHLKDHFRLADAAATSEQRYHCRHLTDPRGDWPGRAVVRSALGLVAVYNLLPGEIARCSSVASFQSALQALVRSRAEEGVADWQATLSPRTPLASHPLLLAPRGGTAAAAPRPQRPQQLRGSMV